MKTLFSVLLFFSFLSFHAQSKYPPFSWDKVPVYAHLGNLSNDFTATELDFLAEHFDFITIEKGMAKRKHGVTEIGFQNAATEIKKRNPKAKVLFYWNTTINVGGYKACQSFPKEGVLRGNDGKEVNIFGANTFYDYTVSGVSSWWSDAAKQSVSLSSDGIFADAINKFNNNNRRKVLGVEKIDKLNAGLLNTLRDTKNKLGNNNLIIQNGLKYYEKESIGLKSINITDGAMIEHFVTAEGGDKEHIAHNIESLIKGGKQGKVMVCKAWPSFDWRDKDFIKSKTYEQLAQIAKDEITFPLACFLVAAQKYSYFCYTWGYQNNTGTYNWYSELDKPLGKPLGDAKRNGWVYTREFANASVFVDIEHTEAKIDWK